MVLGKFQFVSFLAAVLDGSEGLVVPLSLHDHAAPRWSSFLSLGSSSQSQLQYYRARHNNTHAIEYYGQVSVGNQTFSVLFDTGSDQLILPGMDCISDACHKHRVYDPSKSKTAKNMTTNEARDCHFGAGAVQGYENEDRVCLGDACADAQFVAALIESDDPFLNAKFDGVLGLSLKLRKNATEKTSILEALAAEKAIPSAQFSVFLSKDLHSEASEISFGTPNPARAFGKTTWVPLSEPGYWQFSLKGISVGGKELGGCAHAKIINGSNVSSFYGHMCCRDTDEFDWEDRCQFWDNASDTGGDRSRYTDSGKILDLFDDGRVAVQLEDGCVQKVPRHWLSMPDGCRGDGSIQAVLDTGSSLMMGPSALVQKITAAIGVKENCTLQDTQALPNLVFSLPSGEELTLTSADYMDTLVQQDGVYCWPHLLPMPETAKGAVMVLGMPFLRTYYTTFDVNGTRVGFAAAKQPEKTSGKAAAKQPKREHRSVGLRGVRPGEQ